MKINTIKVALVGVVAVGLVLVPAFASADTQTVSNIQAQIAALLAQLATMRQQLGQAQGSSTTPPSTVNIGIIASGTMPAKTAMMCPQISRDLSVGSRGSDVSDLQKMLAQDSSVYPQGSVTGYYGPATAQAVIRFQEKNGIASSTAGFFGPISRKFLGGHCNVIVKQPPMMGAPSGTMPVLPPPMHPMPMMPINGSTSTPAPMPMPMSGATSGPDMY